MNVLLYSFLIQLGRERRVEEETKESRIFVFTQEKLGYEQREEKKIKVGGRKQNNIENLTVIFIMLYFYYVPALIKTCSG